MGQETEKLPFFRQLTKDTAANTVVISAVALVPLMAMAGGGVDASRYYMTATRLQAACDAGALAARKAVGEEGWSSADRQIGLNFFDQNFREGQFGMEDLERNYTMDSDGEVQGTASGTLPTAIMDAFGYEDFDLEVECSADINISNTDVMFVLDVTGSMNCPASDTSCTNNGNVEAADAKIKNLRESVLTFYDTVEEATSDSAQVRYGIMPYSNQVNVGSSLSADWMATRHTYQSREADWIITYEWTVTDTEYTRTGSAYNWTDHGTTTQNYYNVSYDECVALTATQTDIYHSSNPSTWNQVSQSGTDPRTTTYTGAVRYNHYTFTGGTYYGSSRRCALNFNHRRFWAASTIVQTESSEEQREFRWAYRPVEFELTSLYSNGSIDLPTGWNEEDQTHTWNGCIEEASTAAVGNFDPRPSNAYDLDIDLVPASENEKWRPMLPTLVYPRYTNGTTNVYDPSYWTQNDVISTQNKTQPTTYCPKAARKLAKFDSRGQLQSWLSSGNGFKALGATYHDFGMIWGARFISPDGIFASENATAPNGDAIARHIVFMTDGTQATQNYVYGLYGIEWWDRRVTNDGTASQLADRHASRFQAACKAARNKNISVWVVAFGTELSQNLIDCATPGRAYQANDAESLDDAFREIAEKIAALRLTS